MILTPKQGTCGRFVQRMTADMKVKCPRCGKETEFQGNPFRPFCSERCKLIDLGDWISERYRIPTRNPDEDEDGVSINPEEPPAT